MNSTRSQTLSKRLVRGPERRPVRSPRSAGLTIHKKARRAVTLGQLGIAAM